jgi:hypothetical protein
MTEDELRVIERRAKAAPKGPWRISQNNPTRVVTETGELIADCDREHKGLPRQESAAEFIANARTDVLALIAEVRRISNGAA